MKKDKKRTYTKEERPGRPMLHPGGKDTLSFSLDKGLRQDLDSYLHLVGYKRSEFIQTLIKSAIYRAIKKSEIIKEKAC